MHKTTTNKNNHIAVVDADHFARKDAWLKFIAALFSGAGLFVVIFTLSPFSGGAVSDSTATEGNIVNQVGYILLGLVYFCAVLLFADRRILPNAISAGWVLIFAIAFWSCFHAYEPMAAIRGVLLTLISMSIVAGVLLLPHSERDFANAGANAVLLLLIINYAALIVIPNIAMHTAAGGEPWHAGSWRGHLTHKNVAAPVFSVLAMFGIYSWRMGLPIRGAVIFLLSALFVIQTQSKTTAGFLPLSIGIVYISRLFGWPKLTIIVHLLFTLIIGALTIGVVMAPTLHTITASITSDPTFTGRDAIWTFGLKAIPERLWDGFGYYSFWLSPVVTNAEIDFEADWDVRGIVSGHNTYMDALLMFGIPSGIFILALLMLKPLYDYLKAYQYSANRNLADFFLMIVIFMTYTGMLETFILNRADAMWLLFVLGSYGMTLLARRNFNW